MFANFEIHFLSNYCPTEFKLVVGLFDFQDFNSLYAIQCRHTFEKYNFELVRSTIPRTCQKSDFKKAIEVEEENTH